MSTAGVGKGHTHELPRTLLTIIKCLVGAVVALLLVAGMLTYYVMRQQQYIEGRGEFRDRESARLQQEITNAVCDLLDQLPEGGLLERPRDKYGCGPGIPLSELPEDVRRRYQGEAAPAATAAPTPTTQPPMGAPAAPNPPRPAPNPPPASNSPKPTPAAPTPLPPDDPIGGVGGGVCDLTGICIEIKEP